MQQALHRSREALATVGLADRAGEWPSTLSGGQKQRVALARALVSAPRILALDEPLGALDALTRIEMQRLVERVWLSNGFTAILVTHDVTEAVALGDRIVVIDHGAITADIPVDLARPRQRGSAEFARVEAEILERLLASRTDTVGKARSAAFLVPRLNVFSALRPRLVPLARRRHLIELLEITK